MLVWMELHCKFFVCSIDLLFSRRSRHSEDRGPIRARRPRLRQVEVSCVGFRFRVGRGFRFRVGRGFRFRVGRGFRFRFRVGRGFRFRVGRGFRFRFRVGRGFRFRVGRGFRFRVGRGFRFRVGRGFRFRVGFGFRGGTSTALRCRRPPLRRGCGVGVGCGSTAYSATGSNSRDVDLRPHLSSEDITFPSNRALLQRGGGGRQQQHLHLRVTNIFI